MVKGTINIWMIITFVLIGLFLFIVGTYFPNLLKIKQTSAPSPTLSATKQTETVSPIIILTETPSLIPTATIPQKSDVELLREAFSKKYNKLVGDVTITISKQSGNHVSGGVQFAGEIGGAWFLAYKTADGWMIVQDGNGTISCETIAPYNFPTEMAPECVDKNGNLITR